MRATFNVCTQYICWQTQRRCKVGALRLHQRSQRVVLRGVNRGKAVEDLVAGSLADTSFQHRAQIPLPQSVHKVLPRFIFLTKQKQLQRTQACFFVQNERERLLCCPFTGTHYV